MNERGAKTIRGLGRVFRTVECNGTRKVDAQEFFVGVNECGVVLSKPETDVLLAAFDTDQDAMVNYDEFLCALRGKMSACR